MIDNSESEILTLKNIFQISTEIVTLNNHASWNIISTILTIPQIRMWNFTYLVTCLQPRALIHNTHYISLLEYQLAIMCGINIPYFLTINSYLVFKFQHKLNVHCETYYLYYMMLTLLYFYVHNCILVFIFFENERLSILLSRIVLVNRNKI